MNDDTAPPTIIPSISPVLFYPDLGAASEWLCRAFGFVERTTERVTLEDGVVVHAELALGNGMIILSQPYDAFEVPAAASVHHHCLYISVADARTHQAIAESAGAAITAELRETDYGALIYGARDLAGYHWLFAQTLEETGPRP
ncbi:MAG: VOC family protein [Pseudomonadota bacterium]